MNKSKFALFVALVLLAIASSSCVTPKKVRYLQDMPIEGMPLNKEMEATIAPFDELRIHVYSNSGKDDELIKPFNVYGANIGGNNINGGGGFDVDINGNIQYPVLGELHVAGLTRLQLQDTIASLIEKNGYVNNPLVVARFLNFKVFYLSSSGGKVLNVHEERCTFLQALAMLGGLDWYTKRNRIGVMREVDGKRVIHYLDPRSVKVFEDDFFVLQQNDIIFTEEMSYRFFTTNINMILTVWSSITSLFAVYTFISNRIPKD